MTTFKLLVKYLELKKKRKREEVKESLIIWQRVVGVEP